MKTVVLFGAGASYGCGHTIAGTPPLGNNLYEELVRSFPESWGRVPEDARAAFYNRGFEEGMQVLWDKYSAAISPLMRHMTLYFAQFRPDGSGDDLYSRFLARLRNRRIIDKVLYSTLNYECVFELSASRFQKVGYWEQSLQDGLAVVWKLHGSCNFLSKGIAMSGSVSFSAVVSFEGGLQLVDPNDAIAYCLGDTGLYPAMALYMNAKPIQVGRSIIHNLQKRWGEVVRSAKRILVVGVYPLPSDVHLWGPLAETVGILGFVGERDVFEKWVAAYRADRPVLYLGERWDQCLEDTADFISKENDGRPS